MALSFCTSRVLDDMCGRPRLKTAKGVSIMCYWHRVARTSMVDQVAEAKKRLSAVTSVTDPRARVLEKLWPPGERWCAGCQSFVPLWYCTGSRCKACASEAAHAGRQLRTYGITRDELDELYALQKGRCAITRQRQTRQRLATDHDHKTGEVRGLLKDEANHGILGSAHESPHVLLSAVDYLLNPPTSGRWIPPEDKTDQDIDDLAAQIAAVMKARRRR